jgi:hypothetical protein
MYVRLMRPSRLDMLYVCCMLHITCMLHIHACSSQCIDGDIDMAECHLCQILTRHALLGCGAQGECNRAFASVLHCCTSYPQHLHRLAMTSKHCHHCNRYAIELPFTQWISPLTAVSSNCVANCINCCIGRLRV